MTVAGCDLGWKHDSTAIVIVAADTFTGRLRVVEVVLFTPMPGQPVSLLEVEQALWELTDVYSLSRIYIDPAQAEQMIEGLAMRGVPVEGFPPTAANNTRMAEVCWRIFRERAIDIGEHEQRLLADLSKMSIVERSANSLKCQFPRDASGHCDAGAAALLAFAAADEAVQTFVPVRQHKPPRIPGIYRDSGIEALSAGRGLPPEYR